MNGCAALAFDSLAVFSRLKKAGLSDDHARIQAEIFREQAELCAAEIRQVIAGYDETRRQELATRGDVQDVRLEVEKVRAEVEKVRAETEKVRAETESVRLEVEKVRTEAEKVRAELKTDIERIRAELKTDIERVRTELKTDIERIRTELKTDIEKVKYDLLKWIFGLGVTLLAVMVTGFGTLGLIMAKALNWTGF